MVISASHDRSWVLNVPNIVSNAENHVFLLRLLQNSIMSLTTMEAYHVALLEGALYFFSCICNIILDLAKSYEIKWTDSSPSAFVK